MFNTRWPKLSFGKHRGYTVDVIAWSDRRYFEWLIAEPWFIEKHPEIVAMAPEIRADADELAATHAKYEENLSRTDPYLVDNPFARRP